MYNIINVAVHLLCIFFIIYAFIPDRPKTARKIFTLKLFSMLIALILVVSWGFIIGEIHNLKSLFYLIWGIL